VALSRNRAPYGRYKRRACCTVAYWVYASSEPHFLHLVQGGGRAIRYGVGVGRQGFGWSGIATIHDKQEWPDWYPPKETIERQPKLMKVMSKFQSGIGMHGGPRNPLGARAM
jgi:lipoprotein-anchoring transpeptidase ErfK/SrfK